MPTTSLSETSIAFKEWSLVCEELAAGGTALILRKGGIAEGRAGFEWKYDQFYLFPTHFHEQAHGLKLPERDYPMPEAGTHRIDYVATLVKQETLTDWDQIQRLAAYHPWTEAVVQDRYAYGTAGSLSVALVRISKLAEPIVFPDAPSYGGCRSWVKIPAPAEVKTETPVLDDAAFNSLKQEILAILEPRPSLT